jgi:hypothetical protein
MINHMTNIASPSCQDQEKNTKKRCFIMPMGPKKTWRNQDSLRDQMRLFTIYYRVDGVNWIYFALVDKTQSLIVNVS